MVDRRYLSLRQVQAELGLWPKEVDDLIRSGRLPAFRIAGHWRVDRLMLERLVDDLTAESETGWCGDSRRHASVASKEADVPTSINHSEIGHVPRSTRGVQKLTRQQQRIVEFVSEGMSNAEIAKLLSVEISTVKSHISRILQRLDLRDREQLIAHVWRSSAMEREA
jgi:DNA-binding CsgD family transcriptional regulator